MTVSFLFAQGINSILLNSASLGTDDKAGISLRFHLFLASLVPIVVEDCVVDHSVQDCLIDEAQVHLGFSSVNHLARILLNFDKEKLSASF